MAVSDTGTCIADELEVVVAKMVAVGEHGVVLDQFETVERRCV